MFARLVRTYVRAHVRGLCVCVCGTGRYWVRSGCHATTVGGAHGCVLACSDSNIAVDNILMGLVKCGVRAVRLGRPENTRPELLQ